jgi:hypothetical protein
MEQQRFIVTDQEVVELQLILRHVHANAMNVRRNLIDSRGHAAPPGRDAYL